jgi:hypothetical protein
MNYRVQFLNASTEIVAERFADASDVAGVVALIEGIAWPEGTSRLRILDESGVAVHWRIRPIEAEASPEGAASVRRAASDRYRRSHDS